VKLEKNWECNEVVHQLFVANSTVRREDLCNTVGAFGVRMKEAHCVIRNVSGVERERNGTERNTAPSVARLRREFVVEKDKRSGWRQETTF